MIDTHLHLWELGRGWYDWNTPELGAVHADSTVGAVQPELNRAGVTSAIVVQAADTLEETWWLLDVAEREPLIGGVVAFLPVDDAAKLSALVDVFDGRPLVGVRQLWHDHGRADELGQPSVVRSLNLLGEVGLPVDVPDAFPRLWPALNDAVARAPRTTFVLDHCGKPPFGDTAAWLDWEDAFVTLAVRPNVILKLSGLFGGSGSGASATPGELDRVVELCRTASGAERVMIGSDWPMACDRIGYRARLDRLAELIQGWTSEEIDGALHRTASRVYGLTVRH